MQKSQTATEYLTILSIAVVLGLIVVATLSDITSFTSAEDANNALLRNQEVGVMSYTASIDQTQIELRNNQNEFIRITNVTIDGKRCLASELDSLFRVGESRYITCGNIKGLAAGEVFEWDSAITYEEIDTNSEFTLDDFTLKGEVAASIFGDCFNPNTDPMLICTCDDLQNVSQYPNKNFALASDIDCSESITYNNGTGFETFGVYTAGFCTDSDCNNEERCERAIGCDYYDDDMRWFTSDGCTNEGDWGCDYNQTVCESGTCGGTWNASHWFCESPSPTAQPCNTFQNVCTDWCGSWISTPNTCFDNYQWEESTRCTDESSCNADYGCGSTWNDAIDTRFRGTFDGNGHTISNIYINSSSSAGLFGVTYQAEFEDLTIVNASVTGVDYVAILAAQPDQTSFQNIIILNSTVTGEDYVGTLAGDQDGNSGNYATFSNIEVRNTPVTGIQYVGGIGGRVNYAHFSDITIHTNITAAGLYSGGAIGYHFQGSFNNAFTTINITQTSTTGRDSGGAIGYAQIVTIDQVVSRGDLRNFGDNGCTGTGGVVGRTSAASVNRSNFIGTIIADGAANGGIVGLSVGSTANIENNYVIANITGGRSATQCYGFGTSDGLTAGIVGLGGSTSMYNYFIGNLFNPENAGTYTGINGFSYNSYTYTGYSFADAQVYGSSSRNGETLRFNYWGSSSGNLYYDSSDCLICAYGTPIDTSVTPNYFYNASNPPLDQWDFVNVWQENPNSYPTLRD